MYSSRLSVFNSLLFDKINAQGADISIRDTTLFIKTHNGYLDTSTNKIIWKYDRGSVDTSTLTIVN